MESIACTLQTGSPKNTNHVIATRCESAIPSRRISIYFDGATPEDTLILEYVATDAEAWEFTSAAVQAGLTVTVDSKIRPELRRLPCRSLWA